MIVPTWCGRPEEGEAHLTPFFHLGTLLANTVDVVPYGTSLTVFDPFIVNGQRVFMETCWLPTLDGSSIDAMIQTMAAAVSPGCASLEAPHRACRLWQRRSDFAANTCSSRSSQPSPIIRTGSENDDITNGALRS